MISNSLCNTFTYNVNFESPEQKYNRCKHELIKKYYKFMNDVIFIGTIESPKIIIDLEKCVEHLKELMCEEKECIERCAKSIRDDIDKEIIRQLNEKK